MTKFTNLLSAIGIGAVVAVTAPAGSVLAQSDSWNALYDRIIRLEHEVKSMNGAGGASAPQGDVSYRLSAMEEQLRKLIGSVNAARDHMQQMQNRIKRLEEHRSGSTVTQQFTQAQPESTFEFYSDEPAVPESEGLDLSVLPEVNDPLPGEVIDGTQLQAQVGTAPEPQVLGQLVIKNDGGLPGSGLDDQSLLPGQVEAAALDNPTASIGNGIDDVYERSYKNLLGRRFGLAEAGFKTVLNQKPSKKMASKTQYWLGETYYVQGRYKQAAQRFLTGYRSYPKGARAPDSLLKLGMSLNKLGQKKQACSTLAEVGRSYPSARKARKQAARELKRAGC